MHATLPLLKNTDFPAIARRAVKVVQVNVGYRCNQSCLHCHVNAGPTRKETMARETASEVLQLLAASGARVLDITGGAPELNPHFRYLVSEARRLGARVLDRCNLTVLEEPGQEGTTEFLAAHQVGIIASLPCYLESNVDGQRGEGVFAKSLRVLRSLNELGYGLPDSGLELDLVYNPQGPTLPPPQTVLEADYKRALQDRYGLVFNRLYTLTNMPIQRFGSTLISKGRFDEYMNLLRDAFQVKNLDSLMCCELISVDWRGLVYDCDFNQILDLPLRWRGRPRVHVRELLDADLFGNPIAVADHCYGCTAGQGSSCGGALKP